MVTTSLIKNYDKKDRIVFKFWVWIPTGDRGNQLKSYHLGTHWQARWPALPSFSASSVASATVPTYKQRLNLIEVDNPIDKFNAAVFLCSTMP